MSTLREALSYDCLPAFADKVVGQYGTETLKHINNVLGKWHVIWSGRISRDFLQENRTFSGDPVRFWWLAKLYLVLHFYRHVIAKDSEFAISGGGDDQARLQTQLKVIGWLRNLQHGKNDVGLAPDCYMAQFLKSSDGP